ncbi:MAG TPA: hypothetical protein VEU78_10430 [Steroidobacteraceae bacterium]|nr:hypothetical protein [Steroidobacteraceae bacterium]
MHTELEHEQAVARLLRALPDEAARPYDFDEFQRRARAAPAGAARLAGARALAAAIVIALAVLAAAIRFGPGTHPAPAPALAADSATPAEARDGSPAERADAAAQYWLERLPREPALVRVGSRAAVETLEDHIAQVDDLLTTEGAGSAPAARLRVLQQERAQLVSSLVQVRYAETLADASR